MKDKGKYNRLKRRLDVAIAEYRPRHQFFYNALMSVHGREQNKHWEMICSGQALQFKEEADAFRRLRTNSDEGSTWSTDGSEEDERQEWNAPGPSRTVRIVL